MDHHFNIKIAKKLDVESAILIHNFYFWIKKNEANKKHFYDGYTWTYNSVSALEELFPYWSRRQIERIINNLVSKGILFKGNYNENKYDRTTWYALHQRVESIYTNGELHSTKRGNGIHQTVEPIPYSKLDNNTVNNVFVSGNKFPSTDQEKKEEKTGELFGDEIEVNINYDYGEEIPKKVARKKVGDKTFLFRNSDVYKLVNFDDENNPNYSNFENLFKGPNFDSIDLVYYFHSVLDWSDTRDKKTLRSNKGWIATVRSFIRGDIGKDKLKLKVEFQQSHQKSDSDAMLKFLNNNY